jgi:acetyl-CoA acyltransferase
VIAGAYDIAIAAGVEVMTQNPMGSSMTPGSLPFGHRVLARYTDPGLVPQGIGAEMIADKWGITREDLDAFGAESQRRAAVATDEGRFEREIIGVKELRLDKETGNIVEGTDLVLQDEGIRRDTTVETLANLKPAFKPDGKITAGSSSQISDGASAALIMTEEKAKQLGLTPRARFHTFALAGVDPVTMLTGPIPSTAKALEKSGLSIDDIDLFEVNEAFASVVLAWQKELKADLGKTNVNGGAIALGHPLGGSGTKLLATLLNELERTGGRYGLQTMCEGGGLANATIIERLG